MKTKLANLSLVVCLTIGFCGCASAPIGPASPNSPEIVLKSPQKRTTFTGSSTVVFPEGKYIPVFQSKYGTFYLAPKGLLEEAHNQSGPIRYTGPFAQEGGLFLSSDQAPKQTQAFWRGSQSRGVAWSEYFLKPVEYEVQK